MEFVCISNEIAGFWLLYPELHQRFDLQCFLPSCHIQLASTIDCTNMAVENPKGRKHENDDKVDHDPPSLPNLTSLMPMGELLSS